MVQDNKKRVCLYGLDQLALIIICDSGVIYDNQTAGNSCLQKNEEGILTVIFDDLGDILKSLAEFTINKIRLTESDADEINKILWNRSATRMLSVDRDKLDESVEAWIYVDISPNEELVKDIEEKGEDIYPTYEFRGFGRCKGVLTWNNSD
ncbi:DUF6210 family protein [Pseudobacteroides cellulosolvens]|uniref:Uncharacterized protein n=1 Tax=Pseudobacteroides cellulosolvens ATCC 35603 = DSM 2933 TaxID=398512 RepID=A0A0L6JXT5_9FIRM|nr:DUF6210 family protein [Pseudobacteroides cellulosolvens]KNY30569.1 hypothetical protein Bccel_5849 [Pseudobacteroides cellulosolvens ATCC 35603 = DSM 2933]KNY30578.1 hypothetical protein Bccel_5858 [Pseudobacteroides cellulosolvens ATCC 35603 = DSM 2933]